MRRRHRAAHRLIWTALAVLLPAVLLLSWALRAVRLPDAPAVRVSALSGPPTSGSMAAPSYGSGVR